MTRPWLAAAAWLLLAVSSRAEVTTAASWEQAYESARIHFLVHRPGQPTTDAAVVPPAAASAAEPFRLQELRAALTAARVVEEGCALPCVEPSAAAAYLRQVDRAALALRLPPARWPEARETFAPRGIPRKMTAGMGRTSASASALPAGLGDSLQSWGLRQAEALGRTPYVAVDGGARRARAGGAAVWAPAGPAPAPAPGQLVPELRQAPLDPATIDRRFHEAMDAEVRRRPTGGEVLRWVPDPPKVVFEDMPKDPDTIAAHSRYGRSEKIAFNAGRVAGVLRTIDPEGTKGAPLADAADLRRYLASHPSLLGQLARQFDTWYVHEMTHAAQSRRFGEDSWFGNWKKVWSIILNGGRYPVEMEWEAFGTQNRYLGEKARDDPSALSLKGPFTATAYDFEDYVSNLTAYRRDKLSTYQDDAGNIDHLRLQNRKALDYYRKALAQESREWPRRSVAGLLQLARERNDAGYPTMALPHIKKALDRAKEGKFLDEVSGDFTATLQASLAGMEARLARAEAEGKPWLAAERCREAILQLRDDLKMALPPRVAKAVAKR